MQNDTLLKRARLAIIGLCLVSLTIVAVRLVTQSQHVTDGQQLSLLQDKLQQTQRENALLKEQLYMQKSFHTLYPEALKMGFVPITDKERVYLR